ncbi:hypothetical protein Bca4012_091272 [Brassica carinata]|uniref:Uncharacterized protein n=1 Tax=Brassica oleracea TaxID=3712 RepID=A0A3P6FZK3_BRAOL|nr:unnamed protein product [Brassica oleracea]
MEPRAGASPKGKAPEPKVGSYVEKTVKLQNRKPATSRRGCHHVLELEPINGRLCRKKIRSRLELDSHLSP